MDNLKVYSNHDDPQQPITIAVKGSPPRTGTISTSTVQVLVQYKYLYL